MIILNTPGWIPEKSGKTISTVQTHTVSVSTSLSISAYLVGMDSVRNVTEEVGSMTREKLSGYNM